jgi:hypothetical protein
MKFEIKTNKPKFWIKQKNMMKFEIKTNKQKAQRDSNGRCGKRMDKAEKNG